MRALSQRALVGALTACLWTSAALAQRSSERGATARARGGARERSARGAATSGGGVTLVPVRATVRGDEIVRTARRFLGVPYKWGGNTPRAFDCSGFTRYVFRENGILLPRTAREQAGVGDAPYPGDLQPGDLLFFYGGRGAQHIAIYVGGDTIIHASSRSHRVRLDVMRRSGMQRGWFGQRLIAVRRVLPAQGILYVPSSGVLPAAALDERAQAMALTPTVF